MRDSVRASCDPEERPQNALKTPASAAFCVNPSKSLERASPPSDRGGWRRWVEVPPSAAVWAATPALRPRQLLDSLWQYAATFMPCNLANRGGSLRHLDTCVGQSGGESDK